MPSTDLAETIGLVQIIAGVAVLLAIVVTFWWRGRLRRAFAFPLPAATTLTEIHVLLVAAAFLLGVPTLNSILRTVAPAAATLPEASMGEPSTQPRPVAQPATRPLEPASTQPAPTPRVTSAGMAAQAVLEMLLIGLIVRIARKKFAGGLRGFGLRSDRLARDAFWGMVGYLASWPAILLVAQATTWLLKNILDWEGPEHGMLLFLEEGNVPVLWQVLAWGLAGLIAPLFEEVFFRGLVQTWLREASGSVWLAIAASGAAFGLTHAPQYQLVPALTLLGMVLGYLYARTGSLTLPIVLHVAFNIRTLIVTSLTGATDG